MKKLLILWAISLAKCDKLDRTYLPPQGSPLSGGYPEDLNLPLEYPKEYYPSNLKSGGDRTSDSSIKSAYPNIALGIDRQSSFTSSSPKFTNRPELIVSKKKYNIPTSNFNNFSETSTFSPVETYISTVGPVTTASQRYSSSSSSFDPKLNYDQYSIHLFNPNYKPNKTPQLTASFDSRDSASNLSNKNIGSPFPYGTSDIQAVNDHSLQQNPSIDKNMNEYVSKIAAPEFQSAYVHSIPKTITPQPSLKTKYPTKQYGGDLDSISETTSPRANKQDSYSTQRVPLNSYTETGTSSILAPGKKSVEKLVGTVANPFSRYSSNPASNNFDIGYTDIQPQRVQAEGDRNAVILTYENNLTPEGFAYSFDTSNGIHADESGTAINGVKAKGSYSFIGDDGKLYTVTYTADENGFLPHGDHLPTAPPIPDAILRGLEQAEKNNILGIVDDGSYDDNKYGHRRYQGVMDHIPQIKYNNILKTQPSVGKIKDSETSSFFHKLPIGSNNGELNETFATNPPTKSSDASSIYNPDETYKKDSSIVEDDEDLSTFSDNNQANGNRLFAFNVDNLSDPRNALIVNIMSSSHEKDKARAPNTEIFDSMDYVNTSPKEHNAQVEYHSGYKYSIPQRNFNDRSQNKFLSNFPSNIRNDVSNPDNERRRDKITAEIFTVPNESLNYRSQKLKTTSGIFTNPMSLTSISTYSKIKSGTPPFYNRQSGKIINEETTVTETVFSTQQHFTSSTTNPFYESDPNELKESNGNLKKSKIHPSSTLGFQSSMSTTPLPSETSSAISPHTSNFAYSLTTPSQITSTLRPAITSRPTSGTTSRLSGDTDRKSGPEQIEGTRISTIKPDAFNQRIFGKLDSQGRPIKTPITKSGFSDVVEPGLEVLTDPRSQNMESKVSFRPGDASNQSSTAKLFGEDFSGPKQPQRFDPKYGYYY